MTHQGLSEGILIQIVSAISLGSPQRFPAVFSGIGPKRMNTFFHPARLTGVWTYWLPSSPAGTAESPNVLRQLLLSSRTKDRPRIVQPSLRDFGYLLPNPTLERVGYSRIPTPGDVSRKPHRLQQHTTRKCPNSTHPSGVSLPARTRKWFH